MRSPIFLCFFYVRNTPNYSYFYFNLVKLTH